MPLLPLYASAAAPDACHEVRAPGGYEGWHVDAEDAQQDLRITGDLYEGYIFHPRYVRRSARYGLWPLRCVPPTPAEFVCAALSIYRGNRVLGQFTCRYGASEFAASTQAVQVRIGPNELRRESQGQTRCLWRSAPGDQAQIEADWVLRPLWNHPPLEQKLLHDAAFGREHRWIVDPSPCVAEGSLRVGRETIAFSGTGYHDHRFGSAPPGQGVRRWMWGRILGANRGMSFHLAQFRAPQQARQATLIEADAQGVRQRQVARVAAGSSKHTLLGLAYPRELRLEPGVELHSPRLIGATAYRLRLAYQSHLDGAPASAWCEIVYPDRLRWPLLDRWIERQIRD
jgi:hypothetical protein